MITLSGDPKSTQHVYRHTCVNGFSRMYMTAEGNEIKEVYQWEAKSQWQGSPLNGDVSLTIRFFFRSKRRRDLDNQNKLILDALNGIVYEDDSQISDLRLIREYDKKRPRIEIDVLSI